MSTKHPVTPEPKAAEKPLLTAFWAWTLALPLAGWLAVLSDAEPSRTADAVALALAPALAGFILLPSLTTDSGGLGLIAAWLLSGIGLTAEAGGASSPAALILIVPCALARAIGFRWIVAAAAACVLGYAIAAAIAAYCEPPSIAPFPEFLAIAALAFAAGLMTLPSLGGDGRAAAMSRRVAEVSHDLRTPLTHILGFAEILEREMFGPIGARNVEYAGLIRQSGSHLLELLNDLLDLSKIEAGRFEIELEEFDARAIVEEVLRLSADAATRKTISLEKDSPATALNVRADPRALRRMLMNITGNAIKFTPEGGRVRLAARAEGRRLVLEASDTGPGIPLEERERLGKPYERGASGARAEGVGLGLALVRGLAELHGGALSFHEAPGGGALVRIEMPVMV